MTDTPWTIERRVHFRDGGFGRGKVIREGAAPAEPERPEGRLPRVARLMALALHFDELVRTGAVANFAELARLGHVTRARMSQVMNLVHLEPDIQEALLFLPRTERGRDPVILRDLQRIAGTIDWRMQRRMWQCLQARRIGRTSERPRAIDTSE
jgi:hypothetical protein